jgi:hypothetical protein
MVVAFGFINFSSTIVLTNLATIKSESAASSEAEGR